MVLGAVVLSYKEMDEVTILIFLCVAMLAGCYIVGNIPLIVSMSEEKLQMVSVLGAGLLVGTALAVIIPEGVHSLYSSREVGHHSHVESHAENLHESKTEDSPDTADHLDSHLSIHSLIGLTLVLGFVFMLIVEQVFGGHGSSSSSQDPEAVSGTNRSRFTATLGLVVHAAADGVALGAAATTSQADVEMIVFFAIMLHKAPAAFGLVTFLMHAGMDRSRIRRHLLIFALAAPLFALITYFGISQEGKRTLTSVNATGAAMLFSAGTFLYVSTIHVLPEVAYKAHDSDAKGLRKVELCALVVGALAPVLLSIGHQH